MRSVVTIVITFVLTLSICINNLCCHFYQEKSLKITKCIVEVLTHLIASTDLNMVAPNVSLYRYIPRLRDCYLKQITLLYLCILSIHTRGVMFGRTESSKSNPNLIVCGSAISSRSLSPTLQLASRRWRYPESVLGVGNECTLGVDMGT